MAPKRVRPTPDESDSDSDRDDSGYTSSPASKKNPRSTSSNRKKKQKLSPPPAPGDVLNRMVAAGLPPRGRLFDGPGLLPEEKYEGGKERIEIRTAEEKQARSALPRKVTTKGVGNTLLSFQPLHPRKPQELEYSKSTILTTTQPKRRKKKHEDSDSSSESDSDEDEDAVNLGKVIGQPERVQLAIVAGPKPQMPWSLNAFGHLPDPTKTRKPRRKREEQGKEEVDSDEDEGSKKKRQRKAKKPSKPKRSFKDNAAVLVLHDTPFEDSSSIFKYKQVVSFEANVKGKMNARFFYMMYTEAKTKRLHLRIAITNALPTSENWTTAENTIWVQDFPELSTPSTSNEVNPTHTLFSETFFRFVAWGLGLPKAIEYRTFVESGKYFDFSASKDVQAVVSVAGKHEGTRLASAGGLDSLASAVSSFESDHRGSWNLEYITPLSLPISEIFLRYLYAAIRGVTPTEFDKQSTPASQAAKKFFNREHIKIGYPTSDTVDRASWNKVGRYALRFETKDDVDFDRLPESDARRTYVPDKYSIMHDVKLKSGRVNSSNILLIYHTHKASNTYEAFVYFGSHSPTHESWGNYSRKNGVLRVNLANSELGVLIRISGKSWGSLRDKINDLVPYERTLEPYGKGDVPCPTPKPRVVKKRGKKKKGSEDESD